jgi:predicted transcriptional regulator
MEALEKANLGEGIILSGLEKNLMDYLKVNQGDRYLTVNRIALAIGSSEMLIARALKMLKSHGIVSERVYEDGVRTYQAKECSEKSEVSQTPKVVTPEPTVTEKDSAEGISIGPATEEIDRKISELYLAGNTNVEIAKEMSLSPGTVSQRLCKLHKSGELPIKSREGSGPTTPSVNRTVNTNGYRNDNPKGQSYDKLAEEKGTKKPKNSAGRPEGQSTESIEIDNKIKKLYPGKGIEEIATEMKLTYGVVQGRIQRLREAGEITEYIPPERRGGKKVPCPECGEMCGNRGGMSAHMRNSHGIKMDMDKEYADVDRKIKLLYPAKGPTEIAKEVGVNTGIVSSRLTKMHKSGEITEYWNHKKPSNKLITTSINQTINSGVLKPTRISEGVSEKTVGSFNVGQLLKVSSENQVAVVNATLEVIDENGCEYEVTINRTNKGLILTKELIKQLIDTLEYRIEEIDDIAGDAQRDDPEWFQGLMEEQYACERIIEKVRKEVRMPEEKVRGEKP